MSDAIRSLRTFISLLPSLNKWTKVAKKSRQRLYVLEEWAGTERTYLQDLSIMIKDIQQRLLKEKILSEEQSKNLFPNIEAIQTLSKQMLEQLTCLIEEWHPLRTLVGARLLKFHKFFMVYQDYCNNYHRSETILASCSADPRVKAIEAALPLSFQAYLIKPVQRPLKYSLLLREYCSALKSGNPPFSQTDCHPDLQALELAMNCYNEVNEANNSSMERQVKDAEMLRLEHLYGGVVSERRVRTYVSAHQATFERTPCTLHLFSNLLLVASPTAAIAYLELDSSSYLAQPISWSPSSHHLFICAKQRSVVVKFNNDAILRGFLSNAQKQLNYLRQTQASRFALYEEQRTKMRNLEKYQLKRENLCLAQPIIAPTLRIYVCGVYPSSSFDPTFAVRIQAAYPHNLNQIVGLKFSEVIQMRDYLGRECGMLNLPELEVGLHGGNEKQNEEKIGLINMFLNMIFRDVDLQDHWQALMEKLGVHSQLWLFFRNPAFTCRCRLCLEMPETFELRECLNKLKDRKTTIREAITRISCTERPKKNYGRTETKSWKETSCLPPGQTCPYNYFYLQACLRANKHKQSNFEEVLALLSASLGSIDFSQFQEFQPETLSHIEIELPSLMKKYITLAAHFKLRISVIIQKLRLRLGVSTLQDYSLFLCRQATQHRMGNDQFLRDALRHHGLTLSDVNGAEVNGWKICLRKWVYLPINLQKEGCLGCPQRVLLYADEILYRIRHSLVSFGKNVTMNIYALYILLQECLALPVNSQDLLPEHLCKTFRKSVDLEGLHKFIEKTREEGAGIGRDEQVMKICKRIVKVALSSREWSTQYFLARDANSLRKEKIWVGVGEGLLVVESMQRAKLAEYSLIQPIKVTADSILLKQGEKYHTFETASAFQIASLLETRLALSQVCHGPP